MTVTSAARRRSSPAPLLHIPKAAEVVADAIRRDILSGKLHDGEALPVEKDLIARFRVARGSLREALRILEQESLIRIARGIGGGPRVCRPTVAVASRHLSTMLHLDDVSVADVMDARIAIEPMAARLAAERNPRRASAVLRAAVAAERRAETLDELLRAIIRFQEELARLSGSRTLELLVLMLHELVEEQALIGARRSAGLEKIRKDMVEVHSELAALIGRGRGAAAQHLWAEFCRNATNTILKGARQRRVDYSG